MTLFGLPEVEAGGGGHLADKFQQGGGGVVEGDVDVAATGGNQRVAVVNQGAQVAVLQGLGQPGDQDFGLGILDPFVAAAIHRQVMIAVQAEHHTGKLAAQALMPLARQVILLDGEKLAAAVLRHLPRQQVDDPIGHLQQPLGYFVIMMFHNFRQR